MNQLKYDAMRCNFLFESLKKFGIWYRWAKPKLKSGVSKRDAAAAGRGRPLGVGGGGGEERRGTRAAESHPTDDIIRLGSSLSHDGDPRATATHCSLLVRYLQSLPCARSKFIPIITNSLVQNVERRLACVETIALAGKVCSYCF